MKKQRARFIAGATCPKCHLIDTLQIKKEQGIEVVTCIHCGHQQSQEADQVAQAAGSTAGQVIGIFKPE